MIQYQEKPFYLNDEDIHWVEHTLASMTLEEKIGQLFCVTDMITDPEALKAFVQKYHIGGFQTGGFGESDNIAIPLKEALERAGFTVSLYDYATMERGEIFTAGVQDMQKKFDLASVAANVSTGSNDMDREEFLRQVDDFMGKLSTKTMELGGQISGEHGIGMGKVKYLAQAVGETNMELMRGIKKVFDPKMILNPGKVCYSL